MNYSEWKTKKEKEYNAFPFIFAFSNDQFKKAMNKIGLTEKDTDKLYSIGGGGYILKTDSKRLNEMTERFDSELKENFKNYDFAFSAFSYELANHEYCITGDYTDTFDCLGLEVEEVMENEMLKKALFAAKKEYLENEF